MQSGRWTKLERNPKTEKKEAWGMWRRGMDRGEEVVVEL